MRRLTLRPLHGRTGQSKLGNHALKLCQNNYTCFRVLAWHVGMILKAAPQCDTLEHLTGMASHPIGKRNIHHVQQLVWEKGGRGGRGLLDRNSRLTTTKPATSTNLEDMAHFRVRRHPGCPAPLADAGEALAPRAPALFRFAHLRRCLLLLLPALSADLLLLLSLLKAVAHTGAFIAWQGCSICGGGKRGSDMDIVWPVGVRVKNGCILSLQCAQFDWVDTLE
mmetsp:Transcript_25817/g.78484  ORF Transcript_25817/g.78484 Transcript_25817/m.78484 type:complete len:223 (+) Transcript_25817:333-1001(+)